jgi:hypothetical protein
MLFPSLLEELLLLLLGFFLDAAFLGLEAVSLIDSFLFFFFVPAPFFTAVSPSLPVDLLIRLRFDGGTNGASLSASSASSLPDANSNFSPLKVLPFAFEKYGDDVIFFSSSHFNAALFLFFDAVALSLDSGSISVGEGVTRTESLVVLSSDGRFINAEVRAERLGLAESRDDFILFKVPIL